ncbi:MAG: hypothetical protein J4428_04730 [Candidatus Aenigmarchaeota archaeon]|nr:hypothetical protein [Candidatus Aenigmarchaeota archaeon]
MPILNYPTNSILFGLIVPFLISFTIFFGALSIVKIFDKKINLVLSIIISLFVLNSGYYDRVIAVVGTGNMLIFFALIIIITILIVKNVKNKFSPSSTSIFYFMGV